MDLPFHPPADSFKPLAERMRPRSLDEFMGQETVIGPGTLLRRALEHGVLNQSLILWGPPGCGKTTLAKIIAHYVDARFVTFSAVTSGIADVKKVASEARKLRSSESRPFILFIDEIHRFNKAQQDAFLPSIEDGTIVLIGATTENPGFEVIRPLLSRSRVIVLRELTTDEIRVVVERALGDAERGLGGAQIETDSGLVDFLAESARGDARIALNALDYAASVLTKNPPGERRLSRKLLEDALQQPISASDKAGEIHFNLISALHKSVRGGDADASLYWLTRMCEAGEDPLYIARRLVVAASEDIGNADPHALVLAVAVRDAIEFLGYPECKLALAQLTAYLALAPKSNASLIAYQRAAEAVSANPPYPVPLHIRNAPTRMMKDLGYGKGYRYPHDLPGAFADQDYLPDPLKGSRFYDPKESGFESELRKRLEAYLKKRGRGGRE